VRHPRGRVIADALLRAGDCALYAAKAARKNAVAAADGAKAF
jgi:hypothetical protein